MSEEVWPPPWRQGTVAPVNERRRPSKAAPSKTPISATGNQGPYTRTRSRVQALPFGADVDALIRRDPRGPAALLAKLGNELGIRGSLEQAVFRRAGLGRPRLIWTRCDGSGL